MLVKIKATGHVEDIFDYKATELIAIGVAEAVAEQQDEPKTCTRPTPHVCTVNGPCNGWPRIEMATLEPKAEHAVARFFRTMRSRS
jgi:hypothetical protein